MSKQTYSEKLKDPRWQEKRLRIMNRAGFKCEDCKSDEHKTLHVHHCLYFYGRDPWEYDDFELRCLCEDCHESRAPIEQSAILCFKRVLARLTSDQIEQLLLELAGAEFYLSSDHGKGDTVVITAPHALKEPPGSING